MGSTDQVYIIGIGMTRFGRHLDRSIKDLTREAVEDAMADAGIDGSQLDAAWFANSTWGFFDGQDQIRGQVALGSMGIHGIPIMNAEGACGGGSQALHAAWLAVRSGVYECVLAVGSEKLYNEDKMLSFKALAAGTDVENIPQMNEAWVKRLKELGVHPEFDDSDNSAKRRGPMMDMYGLMVQAHMNKYGTTQRQLAVITSKNHWHGAMNPKAQYQMEMTIEEVLEGREVVYPLTVPMCAPLGDGSAAAILCTEAFLKRLKESRPVKILASVYGSNTPRHLDDHENAIEVRLSRTAYEMAGVGPGDIDLLEVHDAACFAELEMTEQLGFCKRGEGGLLAEAGETKLGGRIPVNVSGGLVSRGHPLAATGLAQVYEIVTQLRGEAGARQVEGARFGMGENGGGQIYFEAASMGIHILERGF